MTKINIDQAALRRIETKLNGIANMAKEARVPMEQSVEILREQLADYPQKSPGAFSRLATPAQKRAYFAKMSDAQKKSGKWAYKRTGKLGDSWTTKVRRIAGGLRGEVGTNNPYAGYVQRAGQQQPFHLISGWVTGKRAVRERARDINKIWDRWILKKLRE